MQVLPMKVVVEVLVPLVMQNQVDQTHDQVDMVVMV
jgi:hypothetical protein